MDEARRRCGRGRRPLCDNCLPADRALRLVGGGSGGGGEERHQEPGPLGRAPPWAWLEQRRAGVIDLKTPPMETNETAATRLERSAEVAKLEPNDILGGTDRGLDLRRLRERDPAGGSPEAVGAVGRRGLGLSEGRLGVTFPKAHSSTPLFAAALTQREDAVGHQRPIPEESPIDSRLAPRAVQGDLQKIEEFPSGERLQI